MPINTGFYIDSRYTFVSIEFQFVSNMSKFSENLDKQYSEFSAIFIAISEYFLKSLTI